MNKYSSYKDSEVDWIGEVPTKWSVSRVKKYFKERNEKVSDLEYDPLSVTKNGIVPQLDNVSKSDNHNDRKRVSKNDFVINSRSDRKGSSGMSEYNGSVSLINIVLRPISINPKYSEFLFKSKSFIEEFFRNGKGIHWDLWSTRYSELQNIKIPYPSIKEQQQIVTFLDDKTQKIDSLIQQKKEKIELLKEKRTSLINRVVTKGLNPNVEMKDSGVEWIGEIPNHWGCFKMKYGVNHISEKSQPNKTDIRISPENVESNTGVCFNLYSEHESEGMRFISGDVLLNKLRLYLKKILFTEYDGYSLGEMIVLRTNESLVNKYFYHILFNQGLIDLLDSQSTGVKLPRVSPDIIMNSEIIYPPISEQQKIVEYLDKQTEEIDTLIKLEQKKIDTLKEYRQSLISEVVTGKIRVCEEDNSLSLNSQIV